MEGHRRATDGAHAGLERSNVYWAAFDQDLNRVRSYFDRKMVQVPQKSMLHYFLSSLGLNALGHFLLYAGVRGSVQSSDFAVRRWFRIGPITYASNKNSLFENQMKMCCIDSLFMFTVIKVHHRSRHHEYIALSIGGDVSWFHALLCVVVQCRLYIVHSL